MTGSIERYDLVDGNPGNEPAYMAKDSQGEWVRYTELTTLLQRCEKAEAEAERLLKLNGELCDNYNTQLWDKAKVIDRAELAERQRDEALKALEPFAKRADEWKHNSNTARVSVKLADLRAARNAMGEPE